MNPADLLVRGRLRDPEAGWVRGAVSVRDGKVAKIAYGPAADELSAHQTIDVGDDFVLPGAVDAHVHSYSHPGEGIEASTRAAAAGGVTTIIEMPFDGPGPINSRDRLLAKQDIVDAGALIDVALLGTVAPEGGWRAVDDLVEGGVVGFKVSLFLTDPYRFPRINDRELLDVMKATGQAGRTVCVHAENNEIVKAMIVEEGAASKAGDAQAHTRSRPPVAETLGALTALEVAANTGAKLHLCHLSLPRGIDLVGWYRSQGADVSVETCPHYLTFSEQDLDVQRGRLKINPPLRRPEDRDGLWTRMRDGLIDVVSSDHAPWSPDLKDHAAILDNHSGVPGVETLVAGTLGRALSFDDNLATFSQALDALTIAPAARYGLASQKGSLEVGKDADIMVFKVDADYEIDERKLHSNAGWSPYNGRRPGGHVTHTINRGKLVWTAENDLLVAPGAGNIVEASA